MSKTRPHNSIRMLTAELTEYLSKLSVKDTVSLIHFTDRILGIYTYAGYTKSIQAVIDSLRFIPKGNTDFSVALNALDEISRYRRVIIISDGLNKAHLQSSVFKLSKDLIDSIHEEGIVSYTS